MNEIILSLVGIVLAAIAAPIGRLLGQFIKEEINSIKHQALEHATWILVQAAQGLFRGNGRGVEKYEYVMQRLEKKFPWASHIKLKEFIEVSVSHMKNNLGNEESLLTDQ